jgi:hypothetical protein
VTGPPRPFYCLPARLERGRRLAAQLANYANGAAMMRMEPRERAAALRECAALLLAWAHQTEIVHGAADATTKGPPQ